MVNFENNIQIERAIFKMSINPKAYTGNYPVTIELIGEHFVLTEWWIAFLLTFFHIGITSFIYSFRFAKSI